MQHHRKGLRAALATLGGLQGKLAASPALVASCVSLLGCADATRLVPLSPATVRDGTAQVEQHGTGHVVDGDGDSHVLSRNTVIDIGSREVSVATLIDGCGAPRDSKTCLLDDPAAAWTLPITHRVLDKGALTAWTVLTAVTGGLVLGNYECFGPGCGTGAKVAVGIGDGLVLLGAIAIFELASHYQAPSCGPLAPPCMPREELG